MRRSCASLGISDLARFEYQALSQAGDIVSGEMDAASGPDAIARLREQALLPIRAIEKRDNSRIKFDLLRQTAFPRKDLALFMQQLARLLQASLALDRALDILTTLTEDRRARRIVQAVLDRVRDGAGLAEAMEAEQGVFPSFCISMVRAGEESGALRQVLERIEYFLARSDAIQQKVTSALTYPAILLVVAISSISLIFTLVLPQFEPMLQEAGAALPFSTSIIMAISRVVRDDWWLLVGALLVSAVLLVWGLRQAVVLEWRDRTLLRLPLLAGLISRLDTGRFARTLSVLLANGVPAARALPLATATLGNRVFINAAEVISEHFKQGVSLSTSLESSGQFPPLAVQLVRIGEETGRLEQMLLEIAEICDIEIERTLDRFLELLVPGITIVMGAFVAFIVASVMSALVSINALAI